MISVNWWTRLITIPQSYLTALGGTLYELDVNQFRLDLKDLEDGPGMPFPDTHEHRGEITISGDIYARSVQIINGYTVEFEDSSYRVKTVGANHNISDVQTLNRVQVITNNSGGLVRAGVDRVIGILEGDQEYRPTTYRILDKDTGAPLVSKDVTLVTPGDPDDGVDFTEPP